MASVEPDQAFASQNSLQLDIRLGTLTVVSKVPCAKIVFCEDRHEGLDSSIIDLFSSKDSGEVFLGFFVGHCRTLWDI